MAVKQARGQFKVGTRVSLRFGVRKVVGEIVEDLGRIGVGGRRLLRVRLKGSQGADPLMVEVPESDLKIAPASAARREAVAR